MSARMRVLVLVSVALFIIGISTWRQESVERKHDLLSPSEYRPQSLFIPEAGCVPDKETAIKIAEAIWNPIYGETLEDERPFRIELLGDSIWSVCGSLPSGRNGHVRTLGGVAYIEIRKSDGRIVGVGHGK